MIDYLAEFGPPAHSLTEGMWSGAKLSHLLLQMQLTLGSHTFPSRHVSPRCGVCVCVWVRSRCVPRFDTLNFSHDSFDKLWARPVSYKTLRPKPLCMLSARLLGFYFRLGWVRYLLVFRLRVFQELYNNPKTLRPLRT